MGRERPWRVLADAVERGVHGGGGLVLVTGEAGIGKTAMVASALDLARGAGALVGVGGCWDGEGAPGYWPWVQVLRAVRLGSPVAVWDRARAEAGAGLERLLGEHSTPTSDTGGEGGTFAVIDAVTTLLQVVAQDRPLVLAFEDLHWADQASVRLLGVAARQARLGPILLLGTFRDDEVAAEDHPRRTDLLELASQATRVPLAGLDLDAVAILLTRHGADGAEAMAGDVHRRTGGNPFFVEQLAQLWAASGTTSPIPAGVGAAIERRLARLPAPVAELLVTASVLGARFDPRLLAAVAGLEPTEVGRLLGQARTGGLVAVDPAGEHRFVHDVVREALHASIGADERRHWHAAAARALAAAPDLAGTRAVVQIAHHATLAVPEIPAVEAAALSRAAAEDASARSAHDEAVGHLRRTLALLPDAGADRRDLLTLLATEQRRAGLLDDARATFTRIADEASADDDHPTFALAALGLHGLGDAIGVGTGSSDDHGDNVAGLLLAARGRLDADDALDASTRERLAARVLAALARTTVHRIGEDDRAGPVEFTAQAVARARRSGDDPTLAFCMLARHDAVWAPGTAAERLALTEEMAAAARRCGDHELELQAVLLQFVALLEQGDPRSITVLEGFFDLEARRQLPRWRYVALSRRATLATFQGRFEDASRWITEASALGERLGEVDRHGVRCDQMWELARLQGDDDTTDTLVATYRDDPHILVLEFGAAYDRGDIAGAERLRAAFEELGARWPRWAATVWLTLEVQLAVAAGNRERCERLRAEIVPIADQWGVLGGGVLTRGPMVLWQATLDAALARWDDAIDGFHAAAASAQALGARPWAVQANLGLADTLLARAATGDAAAAVELLDIVRDEAAALGMRRALAEAERLAAAIPAGDDAARAGEFVVDGDVWTITFDGVTIRMPDAKGLHDIRTLISRPGREVPVSELLDPSATPEVIAAHHHGADAVLDNEARAAYRQRLDDLDVAIERALARHDDPRAQHLDAERDTVIAELRAATGLGGRSRRLGGDIERARKTVTARIRNTLGRLDQRHPALAEHLRTSLTTGATCRYQPPGPTHWKT
ncbi:MAG: ATP-binding protein [Acidimicrobiales bacterium]